MRRMLQFAMASAVALAACDGKFGGTFVATGEPDDAPDAGADPGDGPDAGGAIARAQFDDTVAPLFAAQCASCHAGTNTADGPDFLGPGPDAFYNALTGDPRYVGATPADSLLLAKGQHTGPLCATRGDATRTFCETTDNDAVAAWLDTEALERGGDVTPPPPVDPNQPATLTEALTRFGTCMTLADWEATGMNDMQNQTTNLGTCSACHSTGMAGSYLGLDPSLNFEMNRTSPYLLKLVLGTVKSDGSFADLVPAMRFRDKGADPGHAVYVLSAARELALTSFFELTYQRYLANACAP